MKTSALTGHPADRSGHSLPRSRGFSESVIQVAMSAIAGPDQPDSPPGR